MACTNSADIYILWWIVKNKRSNSGLVDRAARMPELLYLPWCLASSPPLHRSPPTPGIPLTCTLSSVHLLSPGSRALQPAVGKSWAAQSTHCLSHTYTEFSVNGISSMWRQCIVDSRKAGLNIAKTSRLEMIAYMCISHLVHTTTSWQIVTKV